jgi:hypothetical protein
MAKAWRFDQLTDSLKSAVTQAYGLKRKKLRDLKWDGPELTANSLLAGGFPVEEALTKENLRYDDEEQGRDAMKVILGCAVRLGIEQGFRMAADEATRYDIFVRSIRSYIENPKPKDKDHILEILGFIAEDLSKPGGIEP